MLNKNDPLIGAVQEVMKRNQAEREAARLVNEKFGVTDRKALPHERQGKWDAAYKSVLTEGVEALDEIKRSTASRAQKRAEHLAKNPQEEDDSPDAPGRVTDRAAQAANIKRMRIKKLQKEEALDEKSFAALAPPYDKPTQKDRLVGRGVLKQHPTQPGKHVLAKEGTDGDTTSPSSMGIPKPDYATGTPAYANKGPQMVNRAAKTSLPAGTVAKSIKEENLEEKAVSKAQRNFFGLVRGIQKRKAHGSAKAEKAARNMSAKSVRDYAKTSEKGLPQKVSEAVAGAQVKSQTQYGNSGAAAIRNPTQRPYDVSNPSGAKGIYAAQQGAADRSAMDKMAADRAPKPSIGDTGVRRPVAPVPAAAPAPKPAARITDLGKAGVPGTGGRLSKPRFGAGGQREFNDRAAIPPAPKPADRAGDTGRAGVPGTGNRLTKPMGANAAPAGGPPSGTSAAKPTAAAPKPNARPAAVKPATKPVVKAVRKAAPTAPTAPAKPKMNALQRQIKNSRNYRDSAVTGPGGRRG